MVRMPKPVRSDASSGGETVATDNIYEIKRFLNILATLSPRTSPYTVLDPAALELAVARFIALQVYLVEGLGLLDRYTCTNATITANLEDDSLIQGTATISGSASGTALSFQTGLFTYRPVDSKGNWVKNYGMASCGELVLITHTNYMPTVNCDVIGYPDYRKLLKVKRYLPENPRHEPSYADEIQQG